MSVEGVEVNVLHGQKALFLAVELTASLGFADVDPVCCPVAGPAETVTLDIGFQKDGPEPIAGVPVFGLN